MRTLALGKPNTAFYGSIRHELHHFGDIAFKDERGLELAQLLEWIAANEIDQVLMPNPYGNPARLECYRALRQAGVTVVASDRGALPGSWFFDHGFNYDSPSYAPEAWDHPLSDEDASATRRYLESLRRSARALETQGPRRSAEGLRARLGLEGAPVLFVPLQRPKDTVVRYFSGSVASLGELLDRVGEVADRLAAAGTPWNVVLKKHPLETVRLPARGTHMRYAPDTTHVHDLIEASDAVLCLNSGVGLLSLCFGKPTGCFGDSFYAHPGLATSLISADDAQRFLEERPAPDPVKVERFVHHLRRRVYSFGKFETELVRGPDGALQRITRHIEFEELRILGKEYPCAGDRVVVVTPVIPTGIYRGSQARVSSVLRAMIANGMRVSLAVLNTSFADRDSRELAREILEEFPQLEHVEVCRHPKFDRSLRGRLRRLGARAVDQAMLGPHRISSLDSCPLSFRRCVAQLCEQAKPHFLFVNYAKLAPAVPEEFTGVTVIDTHDYQTQFLKEDQERNGLRRHINRRVFELTEHRALKRFDRVVAINPDERQVFESIVAAPVFFLPAFSEEHPDRGEPCSTFDHDALLVASMSNFNVKGLLWFVREVMPLIRRQRPDFELSVVGNIARARELRGVYLEGVRMMGVVPDLGPVYEQAACVIAPLLGGAGMKIKVVEALSYGKAIVATPKALDGIRATDGEHLRRARTPRAFADALLSILSSDEERRKLEQGARALHRRDHSFEAAQATLRTIFAR